MERTFNVLGDLFTVNTYDTPRCTVNVLGDLLTVNTYYTPRTVNGVTGISGSMVKGGCLFSLRGARKERFPLG